MVTRIGIVREISQQEQRVALVPSLIARYRSLPVEILIEQGAGAAAHYADQAFQDCQIVNSAEAVYQQADIILKVQAPTLQEIAWCKANAVIIGFLAPYNNSERVLAMRDHPLTTFAMPK